MDQYGQHFGCSNLPTHNRCSDSTVLTDDEFAYGGTTHTIRDIYWHSGVSRFYFALDGTSGIATKTALGPLTLHVDGHDLAVSDSGTNARQITFSLPSNPGWTDGDEVSVSLTLKLRPPLAPTNLKATASGQNIVDLSWTASGSDGTLRAKVLTYRVQRSEEISKDVWSDWKLIRGAGGKDKTSYRQHCVTPGTTYRYRMRADSFAGDSDWSNIAETETATSETAHPGQKIIPGSPGYSTHYPLLGPGERFRLLFITWRGRDPVDHDNIGSYNSEAQTAVSRGHHLLSQFRESVCALRGAGTGDEFVSRRENTATRSSDTDAAIYWFLGGKVADNYEEFYDGRKWEDSNNNAIDNLGKSLSPDAGYLYVLTPVMTVGGELPARSAPPPPPEEVTPADPPPQPEQPSPVVTPVTPPPAGGSGAQPPQPQAPQQPQQPAETEDTVPEQCEETQFDCEDARGIKEGECDALVALYDATCGARWNWAGLHPQKTRWFTTPFAERWQGVTLEEMSVRELSLDGRNLRGELPQELADLESLKVLDLSSNQGLTGDLPRERPEELLSVDIRDTGISRPEWADRIDDFRPRPRIIRTVTTSEGGCAVASGKGGGSAGALLGLLLVAWVLPGVLKKSRSG